jgi:5-formyltetrahydrofolate cyclo-ligase
MDADWVVAASRRIQKAVIARPEFQNAGSVACYLSLPPEVQTAGLLDACWSAGKKVCVPAFNEDADRYELVWIERDEKLTQGRMNIHEPLSPRKAGVMDVDLLIVPCIAYDHSGGRLGHGGGHYDRMLGSWSGFKLGVAFDYQVFEKVPMGSQDIPVDLVITETTTYGDGG